MAHLVIVINTSDSIAALNDKLDLDHSGNAEEHMARVANYIAACQGSTVDASVQLTSRDTAPAVSTSGTGSKQISISLK